MKIHVQELPSSADPGAVYVLESDGSAWAWLSTNGWVKVGSVISPEERAIGSATGAFDENTDIRIHHK